MDDIKLSTLEPQFSHDLLKALHDCAAGKRGMSGRTTILPPMYDWRAPKKGFIGRLFERNIPDRMVRVVRLWVFRASDCPQPPRHLCLYQPVCS
jgi:hypothetical protein